MPLSICTDQDVWMRLGGLDKLVQLLPLATDPSQYDAAALALLEEDAAQEIGGRANVQVDMIALAAAVQAGRDQWNRYLVDIVAWYTVPKVWVAGGEGQAMPPYVRERQQQIESVECERLRKREISLGVAQNTGGYPATNQIYRQVNPDPQGRRMTLRAFKIPGGFV